MTLNEKLAALRREQGLSQEDLAGRLEVSRQAVSKWETGASAPDLEKLLALSDLFAVSADYLLCPSPSARRGKAPLPCLRPPHRRPKRGWRFGLWDGSPAGWGCWGLWCCGYSPP